MAVPDTTTFTLQNVVTEVNPTTNDLVDCFADAIAAKFDSAYSGSKNQLLNFRNYGAINLASFSTSATAQIDNRNACSQSAATTMVLHFIPLQMMLFGTRHQVQVYRLMGTIKMQIIRICN